MKSPNNRPLGTNEKVFWVLDQKNNTQFAIAAELVGNATDRAWREAIDSVQNRHPNLSTRISGNSYQTAKIENVDGCKIPLRIIYAKTGEDWTSIVEEELNDPLDLSVAPLVRAVLVQQSGKTIFIFVSNHSISDGMSVALVIRDVLSVLSGQIIGRLSAIPSLDEIIGVAPIEFQSKNATVPSHTLSVRDRLSISYLRFSKEATNAIIKRSKSEQTTVHGALGSALVMALENESLKKESVRIMHPISARKTLDIGDDFSLLINIVTVKYQPSSAEKFWALAREVRQSIITTQNAEWIRNDTLAIQQLFNSNLSLETIEQALGAGTDHEFMLTNLGDLNFETAFGSLQLLHLWGPMVLTPHLKARTIGAATFNGELTLTVTGLSESPDLLNSVLNILEQACGSKAKNKVE
jgi:NRPS condensation-like uncharacterized protein